MKFGKGRITDTLDDDRITHVVVSQHDRTRLSSIRSKLSKFVLLRVIVTSRRSSKLPRVVTSNWILDCVKEVTRLDESRYAP